MAGQLLFVKNGGIVGESQVQFPKDDERYTPKKLVDYFGQFDYDPATTKEKAIEFGVAYDTIETNGLLTDWTQYKRIWINPPFTNKHEFLKKAQETYDIAKNEIYILFPIEFLTTKRFHDTCKGGHIYIPNGRVNFQSGLGKKGKSPAFGSVIVRLADDWSVELITERGR